ncbi:MAG: PP2C family protein-serine/threonine phosphatase [Polyangiaceae bacterium]
MQPASPLPAVEYAERSDPGRDPDKQVNEDACGHRETRFGHLCVVCDGMGGHAAGREAAELALQAIFETFENAPESIAPAQVLRSAIEEASRRVHVMATSEVALGRPGSTVVAILLHGGGTEVGHIGDSRAYLIHEGQISRITRDHSIVQELVDHGLITADQASRHPDANRITRALGMAPEVEADLRPEAVAHVAGDAFVLCSDGLSDLVEDPEILAVVGGEPAAQAAGKLVDLANARGGHDNITVLVVRPRESARLPAAAGPPTVVQTATMPAIGAQAPAPTLVDTSPAQVTEPVAPPPPRELEPTPPPPASAISPVRGQTPIVVAALVIALVAVALLGAVLVVHMAERRGKRSASNSASDTTPSAALVDAGDGRPTPLVPGSVVIATASASSALPIAPLDPAPTTRRKRKR